MTTVLAQRPSGSVAVVRPAGVVALLYATGVTASPDPGADTEYIPIPSVLTRFWTSTDGTRFWVSTDTTRFWTS